MFSSACIHSGRRCAALFFLSVVLAACGGGGDSGGGGDDNGGNNPPSDTTPDAFGFTAIADAAPGLSYTSTAVTVAGIDSVATVSIAGENCLYAIGNGEFRANDSTIATGQAVTLRAEAAAAFEIATQCTLDIGGVAGTFTVTTGAAGFAFDVQPGKLTLSWDSFAGVSRYELTRHNSASDESVFVADNIVGDAAGYETALSVHLTDWINDRFLLSACNDLGCVTLPEHEVALVQALSAQAIVYAKASNTEKFGSFGVSVSLDGDTLAVGADGENSAATGVNGNQVNDCDAATPVNCAAASGAVYVFRRNGTVWTQEAYIKASNTDANDRFGVSVALDGDTLAVGAYQEESPTTGVNGNQTDDCDAATPVNCANASGAVYVFRRNGTVWTQEAYIKASNTEAFDRFGFSVALNGDTLAVGAENEDSSATGVNGDQHDDDGPDINSGAVYVFRRSGTDWVQEAYVKASNTEPDDFFGRDIALAGDTLAVGAEEEDGTATGVNGDQHNDGGVLGPARNSGAVYVFRRNGIDWTQEAYIKASNTGRDDHFGAGVALDGDTLAVGAYRESSAATGVNGDQADNFAIASGAAYVFRRNGTNWSQEAYVKASNTARDDSFGVGVALDGDTLAVGARREDGPAIGVDGNQADDCDAGTPANCADDSGAVYVFRHDDAGWTQAAYIKASNAEDENFFGESIALAGDMLAIGTEHEDSAATGVNGDQTDDCEAEVAAEHCAQRSGAVYIY